jgi:6-phosphogluconolactonase
MPFAYIASSQQGIIVCQLDMETGKLAIVETVAQVPDCQFVRLHPSKPVLYAVGTEHNASQIYSFAIENGKLSLLNQQPAAGLDPCYIALDGAERYALMVNYSGNDGRGSAAVFPLKRDGQLEPHSAFIQHAGSSINASRQGESHPHMITATPDNRYVLVVDLGIDKVLVYRLEKGTLSPHSPDSITLEAGAGPRHLAFHPTQPYMYVINELNSTLSALRYEAATGIWYDIATVSTLPHNPELPPNVTNYPADLHMHPSGQFLYGSNRGHNSLVVYKIDTPSGRPVFSSYQATQGDFPRGFALDPSGQYVLVGNQHGNSVVSFRVNAQTGQLSPTGYTIAIPTPLCVEIR